MASSDSDQRAFDEAGHGQAPVLEPLSKLALILLVGGVGLAPGGEILYDVARLVLPRQRLGGE